MNAVQLLCDFIEEPEKAAASVAERPPAALGVLAYLLAGFSLFLTEALTGRHHLFGLSLFSLALVCLWRLVAGLTMSSLRHFLAEALGGRGKAVPLFVLSGLSDLSWALALPAALVLKSLAPDTHWPTTLLFLLAGLLALALKARSVKHNYGVNSANAVLTVVLPYIGAVVFILLVFMIGLAGAVAKVVSTFS